jgi:hypothetical protein
VASRKGKILIISIKIKNLNTRTPKIFNRFGFVTFHNNQDATRILESNSQSGIMYGSTLLNISHAYRKPPHNPNYAYNNNSYYFLNKNYRDNNNNSKNQNGDYNIPCTVQIDNSKFFGSIKSNHFNKFNKIILVFKS